MSRETDIKLLMDNWEEKHKNNGYKRKYKRMPLPTMDISVLSEMV